MMFYYLNVQFQGQNVNLSFIYLRLMPDTGFRHTVHILQNRV